MKKQLSKGLLVLSLVLITGMSAYAQNFKGSLFLHAAFSHVNGDEMGGYNKPGYGYGIRVAYPMSEKLDLSFALSYIQKGSRRTYDGETGLPVQNGLWHLTRLHYAEIPVILHYQALNKLSFEGGLSAAYLIRGVQADFQAGDLRVIDYAKDVDISFQVGARYPINKDWDAALRHSFSLLSFDKNTIQNPIPRVQSGLYHHVAMFGIERKF